MAKYCIGKGKHYNVSKIRFILSLMLGLINAEVVRRTFLMRFSHTMTRYVYFSDKCWYKKSDLDKDKNGNPLTGWNKLFGFSGWLIHKFSARLVWQPDFDRWGWIIIALYVYDNGDWTAREIARVQVNTIHKMSVTAEDGYYTGTVEDTTVSLDADKTPHFIKAEPFFGGQSGSPWKMCIYLFNPLTYKLFKPIIHKTLKTW